MIAPISYDFVDDFSFELENDVKAFIAKDYLKTEKRYVPDLNLEDKLNIQKFKNKISSGEKIDFSEMKFHNKQKENTLFTIGYEGISIDAYINRLLENCVKILVDVRRNAYSNKFGFSKKEFQYCLEKIGIKYVHIPELGIESEKRKEAAKQDKMNFGLFTTNKTGIEELFEDYRKILPTKQIYINRLLEILRKYRFVAITCFEADYRQCHRHVLAEFLTDVNVVHI
jgi:uncharacterized protein (DUF488 family)